MALFGKCIKDAKTAGSFETGTSDNESTLASICSRANVSRANEHLVQVKSLILFSLAQNCTKRAVTEKFEPPYKRLNLTKEVIFSISKSDQRRAKSLKGANRQRKLITNSR